MNRPTIVALLYLASCIIGVTGIIGVVLAYVWRGEAQGSWEESHLTYLINTFWIGFIGSIISFFLLFVLIGILTWIAVGVLVVVRSVLSLVGAQRQLPMPNPGSLTW
jgi:uncharacterized membrane protein